jgi:hypothetical protein
MQTRFHVREAENYHGVEAHDDPLKFLGVSSRCSLAARAEECHVRESSNGLPHHHNIRLESRHRPLHSFQDSENQSHNRGPFPYEHGPLDPHESAKLLLTFVDTDPG